MKIKNSLFIFYLIFLVFQIKSAYTCNKKLTILYFERFPYYYTNNYGQPDGILNNITKSILDNAKITYNFKSIPAKRILLLLQESYYACSPGWFYTTKRAKIFKYSLPIYQSEPFVAIFNEKFKHSIPSDNLTLKYLFTSNFRLGLISALKYSPVIEKKLKKFKPKYLKKYTIDAEKMLHLVAFNRIDYTLLSEDYVDACLKFHKNISKKLIIFKIKNMKKGNLRYLLCSKSVDNTTMGKINKSIKKIIINK